ncbi:bile acid:sodium symporter family protein [Planctomycetaceae bacterium SH139]
MTFLLRQWFLLALAIALASGFTLPGPVATVGDTPGLRSGLVACVLFLMGLTVPASSFGDSWRSPKAGLLALSLNVVAVPFVAWIFAQGLPASLAGGLIVAAAVPCTLASALAWTRKGGGNEVVAMMVMLITNGCCFFIAPTTLWLLLGQTTSLSFSGQVLRLATLVVLPLTLASLLRLHRPLAAWADRHKLKLTQVALCGILLMVAFGAAETKRRVASQATRQATTSVLSPALASANAETSPFWITAVAIFALATHLIVLGMGWTLAGAAGLGRADQVAVGIAGSQKTLMVGLQISIDCGVSTLPMTMYHIGQLLADTVFVGHVARNAGKSPAADKQPEAATASQSLATAGHGRDNGDHEQGVVERGDHSQHDSNPSVD